MFSIYVPCMYIVFNLVEGIDVEETNARVREYQTKNAENIAENEARKVCVCDTIGHSVAFSIILVLF